MGVKNERFWYQLTQWLPSKKDLKFAIKQIEKYKPNSEDDYYVIKKNKQGAVAVFTKGLNVMGSWKRKKGGYDTSKYKKKRHTPKSKKRRVMPMKHR